MTIKSGLCYVVGAMPLSWSLCPRKGAGDFLIAADKGYEALEAYGAPPDLVVGDFDSLGRRPNHPNVIQLPVMKDDTDMVYALREGLERGYRRFVLLGGVGGRLEHTLANLQSLAWLTTQGARGVLAGEGTVATALHNESMTFPQGLQGFLSVFCSSGVAKGVRLENLKYELNDHTMSADFPLGVSNEFVDAPAKITVGDGTLLALWREYNANATPEARLVKALDKAETIIQHNQGRNPEAFDYRFNLGYGKEYFEGSGFLRELRTLLDEETAAKLHGTD